MLKQIENIVERWKIKPYQLWKEDELQAPMKKKRLSQSSFGCNSAPHNGSKSIVKEHCSTNLFVEI